MRREELYVADLVDNARAVRPGGVPDLAQAYGPTAKTEATLAATATSAREPVTQSIIASAVTRLSLLFNLSARWSSSLVLRV